MRETVLDLGSTSLCIRDRLVVTPHVAFYSPESYEEMRLKAAEEAVCVVEGEQARNCVN